MQKYFSDLQNEATVGPLDRTENLKILYESGPSQQRIQGGLGPCPLAPKICQKSCSFQAILREKPLFWANFGLSPPLGVKTPLGPPDQNSGSTPASDYSWIRLCSRRCTGFIHILQRAILQSLTQRMEFCWQGKDEKNWTTFCISSKYTIQAAHCSLPMKFHHFQLIPLLFGFCMPKSGPAFRAHSHQA